MTDESVYIRINIFSFFITYSSIRCIINFQVMIKKSLPTMVHGRYGDVCVCVWGGDGVRKV